MSWENPRRRRRAAPRRRRYSPRRLLRRFRKRPKTVPLEMVVGAASIPFMGSKTGYSSPVYSASIGDWAGVADALINGFTPVTTFKGNYRYIDVWGFLNPFNFEQGRYMKILLWTGLGGLIRKKLIGRYTTPLFRKIPIIGRWVS